MRTCALTSPQAELRAANSTADGARLVAEELGRRRRCRGSADRRGDVRARDHRRATSPITPATRPASSWSLARAIPPPTGHDRTALVIYQRADEPGSPDLDPAGVRRPSDQPLEPASRARPRTAGSATTASSSTPTATSTTRWSPTRCASLRAKQGHVKFLGSYPAAGAQAHIRPRARRRPVARSRRLGVRPPCDDPVLSDVLHGLGALSVVTSVAGARCVRRSSGACVRLATATARR